MVFGRLVNLVHVVSFELKLNFLNKIEMIILATGSCCGDSQIDGCVENVEESLCPSSAEWVENGVCSDVCSKFFIYLLQKNNKFFFLAGACCGPDEIDGCVDNIEIRNCSSTSEWTRNDTCANVCGMN